MGEGQAFTRGISEIHAGASIILRGVGQANQEKSGNPKEKYARLAKEGKRQEIILEDWARVFLKKTIHSTFASKYILI